MKALSVKQPWAARIAEGRKTIEVRSKPTKYRGPLLICVSKTIDWDGMTRVGAGVHTSISLNARGRALCLVDLVDCQPMRRLDEGAAMVPWREGAFAWKLANPRPVRAVPIRGQLGIFNVDAADLAQGIKCPQEGYVFGGGEKC